MKEYTLFAFLSAAFGLILDRLLRTRIAGGKEFWITMTVMMAFKIPSNGYLTGRPIVLYNPDFFLGIRLGSIPVEDFLYGFGLITITLVLWEYFVRKEHKHEV